MGGGAQAMTATVEVVWRPNDGPQEALLACPIKEVLYGGARGGGKTDGLLGDFCAHAGRYGQQATGILVRRTYDELAAVIERSKEIYAPLGWTFNATSHEWRASNGALLRLRYLKRDADAAAYQGHSYTWIGVDEAGNFPSEKPINLLRGTLRSAHGVPCTIRLTGNPGGPGHGWLKRRYIDPHPAGLEPFTYTVHGTSHEAVFIASVLDDNPFLGEEYEAELARATEGDTALYEAWRRGRWDVFVGQMYRLVQGEQIVRNRKPNEYPATTKWFACLDWGYVQGCYGLYAVDGEHRTEKVAEFYEGFSELHARKAAHAIVEWHKRAAWPLPKILHADEQMWQRHGSAAFSLSEEFNAGLRDALPGSMLGLSKAKHPPGSRETKVALLQAWLAPSDKANARNAQGALEPWAMPRLTIAERCAHTIRVLQEIPRDPDNPNDVDPDYADDHPHDETGFAVASRPQGWRDKPKHLGQDQDVSPSWKEIAKKHGTYRETGRGGARLPRRAEYEELT